MSSSTTPLDGPVLGGQGNIQAINDAIDALSPSAIFGRRRTTTSLLSWGYNGGTLLVNGTPTAIAAGAVALTASTTNYVARTPAGVVSVATTRNPALIPLYTVVTDTTTATSYVDERVPAQHGGFLSKSIAAGGTVTLTQAEAACGVMEFTGVLPNDTSVVVPALAGLRIQVHNKTTGAFSLQVKTPAGLGVTIPQGHKMGVYSDGVDVEDAQSISTSIPLSGVTGLGTGVATALATNTGSAGAVEINSNKDATGGYAGLTGSALNLKNAAGTFTSLLSNTATAARAWAFPDKDGTIALTNDKLSAFAATTSAELAGVISDETGTGALVLGTSPTFTTGIIISATSGASANPAYINMGGSFSNSASLNLKFVLYDNGTVKSGIGFSAGQMEYVSAISTLDHVFYGSAGTELMRLKAATKRLGIGIAPTATLHLQAGTAAASGGSLKFTNGTLTTTPEAGLAELSTVFYDTDSAGTRKRRQYTDYTTAVFAITPPASLTAYQNATGFPLDVLITGGTVTLIEFSRDGTTWYDVGNIAGMVRLSQLDRVRVTYSVAPTMTGIPR